MKKTLLLSALFFTFGASQAHGFLNEESIRNAVSSRVSEGVENFNKPWFCQTKNQGFGPYTGIGQTKEAAKAEALKECGIFCSSNKAVQCEKRDSTVFEDAVNGERNRGENNDRYIQRLEQRIADMKIAMDRQKDEIRFLRNENDDLRRGQRNSHWEEVIEKLKLEVSNLEIQKNTLNNGLKQCSGEVVSLRNRTNELEKNLRLCRGDDYEKPDLTPEQISACDYATSNGSDLTMCMSTAKKYELSTGIINACDYATSNGHELKLCLEAVGIRRPRNPKSVVEKCDYATSNVNDLIACINI
ncbi:hypothetical protein M899_2279 [Bacteriovorax sp. BSW11_IV]|uniref:hypothetical protein n=1 Tax=Bacteriovorax sp. BSW11_IV TaxID=1353529 RepID=UPI00038A11DF|nr:hypothetical protein [Bacteriovorax sp. BSW11_IV]EQC48788.1 hypothetical protein M899_2279 [Bacteriovorax sp. BSW11_IV]